MPTYLPTGIAQAYGPNFVVQGGRFDYNSASGTYSLANIPPNTFVKNVGVMIMTTWSGGGAACFFVGSSLHTAGFFTQVTIATAGGYHSFLRNGQLALGTLFVAANNVTLRYTADASDTQGSAFFFTEMLYLPDLNVGGIVEAF